MVTVVKGLFTAAAAAGEPPVVLSDATRAIKQMNLDRMNMGVSLVRFDGGRLTVSAAGMPPVFVYRRSTEVVEEVALPGMPLGGLAEVEYGRWDARLGAGDTVLLMTDGFPELLNPESEPFGYERTREVFAEVAGKAPQEILGDLASAAERWSDGTPLNDDMTFVVMKVCDRSV